MAVVSQPLERANKCSASAGNASECARAASLRRKATKSGANSSRPAAKRRRLRDSRGMQKGKARPSMSPTLKLRKESGT